MRQAYDPKSGRNLTVQEYKDLYVPKADRRGEYQQRLKLTCIACGVGLHTIAETTPTSVPTWGHDPSPATDCPIKAAGASPYKLLRPKKVDPESGIALRKGFFANWAAHWAYIRTIVPVADIDTLVGFLKTVDKTHFWDQRHLQEWHLPYVFLATCDFPPAWGKAHAVRPDWLRFRFDRRYPVLDDLWIWADPKFTFLRFSYEIGPRQKGPRPSDAVVDAVPVTAEWLKKTHSTPTKFATDRMTSAFPKEIKGNSG